MRNAPIWFLAAGAVLAAGVACGSDNPAAVVDAGFEASTAADTGLPNRDSGATDAADAADAALPDNLLAGASKHDITPRLGAPLGGYGARRSGGVDLDPNNDVTFFRPSTAVRDPLYCRALVLDNGATSVAMLAVDAVAISNDISERIIARARALGLRAQPADVMLFASHTHAGPGAVSRLRFWEQVALDLYVGGIADSLVEGCALALAEADRERAPAKLGLVAGAINFATSNRRAGVSPTATSTSIDPEVFTLRVDRRAGGSIATLWNFAIHGTALPAANLMYSADIMGDVSRRMEAAGEGVALFANAAEGDISPSAGDDAGMSALGAQMFAAIAPLHARAVLTGRVELQSSSKVVPFGQATLRVRNDNAGGQIDLGALAALFPNGISQRLGPDWIDNDFRFQALRINGDLIVSVPGEPIREIGNALKAEGKRAGFDHTMVFGLANGHMGYVTTEAEYNAGGYESLVTMFGDKTAEGVFAACKERIQAVKR